jgi:glutamate dehydrogenase/leucine dehydrogenase
MLARYVVHAGNVARLQTRIVAEGANILLSAEAEQTFADPISDKAEVSVDFPDKAYSF